MTTEQKAPVMTVKEFWCLPEPEQSAMVEERVRMRVVQRSHRPGSALRPMVELDSGYWSDVEHYPSDMGAAWQAHLTIMNRLFSVRQRYYAALERFAAEKAGARVAWPDVLTVLAQTMPAYICAAALLAVGALIEGNGDR